MSLLKRVRDKLEKVIKTGTDLVGVVEMSEKKEKKKTPFPFPEPPEELPRIEEWLPAPPPELPLPRWLVKRIKEAKK